MTSGERINWLQRFERHKLLYSYLLLALYLLLNNSINATSVWMEYSRHPANSLQLWEPFVWEYSSALATLMLSPLLFWWFDRQPLRLSHLRILCLAHLVGSLLFSLAHSGLMVAGRELVYAVMGGNYDFGAWPRELFYEYRKDAWGYLSFLGTYQLLRFVYHRLTGDARLISGDDELADSNTVPLASATTLNSSLNSSLTSSLQAQPDPEQMQRSGNSSSASAALSLNAVYSVDVANHFTAAPSVNAASQTAATANPALRANAPQHFLVKKLDREFLVAIADIEWLEASGNYVNLHSKGRIYPLRATLSQTMSQLEVQGFSRIHRSFAVNHRHIDNISYQPSGDGELQLKNGQQLALSRRYKEQFRTRFQAGSS